MPHPSPPEPQGGLAAASHLHSPWGPWATLALGLTIFLAFVCGQSLPIAAAFMSSSWWNPTGSSAATLEGIALDGDVLGASTLAGAILGMLLMTLLIRARGSHPAHYLKLKRLLWWQLLILLAVTYGAGLVQSLLAPHFGSEPIPPFMVSIFTSTDWPLLMALGIAVAAPFFEEWFFRGFLHEGWRRSPLGPAPAILATAVLWTLIHAQYGWFEKTWIFFFGILLSLAREWTGSLWAPIAMHVMNNAVSLMATSLELSSSSP